MKPRILITTLWYLPGYLGGGPIRTISNLVDMLGDEFDFYIITGDRDAKAPTAYANVCIDGWNDVGKAKVFYASRRTLTFAGWSRLLRDTPHDLLYLNSLFDARFTLLPLLLQKLSKVSCAPVLLAPRGELSGGAIQIKALKKYIFLNLARGLGLYSDVLWHASTAHEAKDIYKHFPEAKDRIHIAIDLASRSEFEASENYEVSDIERLRICFLSRIAPMKNLDFALEILSGLTIPVLFGIHGPKDDIKYWQQCEKLLATLPDNICASYKGSVLPDQVGNIIAGYDLFFVPSRGENYGHVFLESMLAGVPVLTSDQTPWRGLEVRNVGWDIPLSRRDLFAKAINVVAEMTKTDRHVLSSNCRQYAIEVAEDSATVEANRMLFQNCLGVKQNGSYPGL